MNGYWTRFIAGAALALLTMLLSCGGDQGGKVLAVVGDHEITVAEFEDFMPTGAWSFASAEQEFDRKLEGLDSVIIHRILVEAAYECRIDQAEELARLILSNKDRFLIYALEQREIIEPSQPTDAELREYYGRLDTKLRVHEIIMRDPDTAQAVFERLKAGEPFEKLAQEYSVDPNVRRDKGDRGYITWGLLTEPVEKALFQMDPGEITPPIKTFVGYHIAKLDERADNPQEPFETIREQLKKQLAGIKRYRRSRDFYRELREQYPVAIDSATCDYLTHKRSEMYPPSILKNLPKSDFDTEQLDRNERELVIATWPGGQMTVMEYITQARSTIPETLRPDLDDYDSLATMVFALNLEPIKLIEAHRRGLESDPFYQRKMTLYKERLMADLMRHDSIPQPPDPDEAMIRQYYDDNPEEYMTPARVHVFEILLADEMHAQRLKREIKSLSEFQQKAGELTMRPGKRATLMGDLDYISKNTYPEIFEAAWATPVDKIGGPVPDRGKFSIFWVVDKVQPVLKDYFGVKRSIYEKLKSEGERASFEAWLGKRREKVEVEVFEDALWSTIDVDKYGGIDSTGVGG